MVHAYHLIISAYGFWLPNDPRGSWSGFVGSYELYLAAGPATKVETHRSLASVPHDAEARRAAKRALKHPPVRFTAEQVQAIGSGIAKAVEEYTYTVTACAIMPDHAHFVVDRHRRTIEQIRDHFKSRATRELNEHGLNPLSSDAKQSPWAAKGWHVFLDSPRAVERANRYVEENPVKAGLPRQRWGFVVGTQREGAGADAPR